MAEDQTQVTVRILDKDYQFACRPEDRSDLIQSADYLDRMMREIRSSGRVVGSDRIAVMAALNMANELLTYQNQEQGAAETAIERVRRLEGRISDIIAREKRFVLSGNSDSPTGH